MLVTVSKISENQQIICESTHLNIKGIIHTQQVYGFHSKYGFVNKTSQF